MSKKVWLITGASRGMGVDFARAALASGHSVVASGRDRERVSKVLGTSSDLPAVTLDVTSVADAEAAVRAAVDRFSRIDVVVNNAASLYAGYFEELTPEPHVGMPAMIGTIRGRSRLPECAYSVRQPSSPSHNQHRAKMPKARIESSQRSDVIADRGNQIQLIQSPPPQASIPTQLL
jgi:hypothetical protein